MVPHVNKMDFLAHDFPVDNKRSRATSSESVFKFIVAYTVFKKITQVTFTCSKATIETVEKGVKYVQSYQ